MADTWRLRPAMFKCGNLNKGASNRLGLFRKILYKLRSSNGMLILDFMHVGESVRQTLSKSEIFKQVK